MDDFETELKIAFLEEATQLLEDVEQCFLILEKSSDDPTVIEKLFRLAHNMKGSGRAVGFLEMGEFTHHFESLLLKLKNREMSATTETVNLLLRCSDRLKLMVESLKSDLNAKVDCTDLISEIEAKLSGRETVQATPPDQTVEVVSSQVDSQEQLVSVNSSNSDESQGELSVQDLPVEFQVPDAAMFAEPTPVVATVVPISKPQAAPVSAQNSTPKTSSISAAPTAPKDESIRVSIGRLETLMNNVGELVILQTVLQQQRMQIQSSLVQKTIGQLSKITKDIQEISMSLRMVPLKQTFQKMQRIVRDLSKELGKDIDLVLDGEDTEIDKTVVEHLGDPLVHLVRNSVDHGIEDGESRKAKGKRSQGKIMLKAFQQSGQIVIEVSDDGKGLNAEVLRTKAIERGILRADQEISDSEAHRLIFHPGFSTKSQVSDISGRGVGMDVVKTNIEKQLKGEVQLITELGKGTCVRIVLPLTLAIIEGMVVRAGEERFVIPMAHVYESLQPSAEDIHFFHDVGDVLNLRGTHYPLFPLSQLMGIKGAKPKPISESIAMIIHSGERPFAILVDDIIGQQQVVIKQLGKETQHLVGVSGGAILGDGRAALILEVGELAKKHSVKNRSVSIRSIA